MMVKPVDMDEFLKEHFKEQQERMDISDEDWGEYEERMHRQRLKRKLARHETRKNKSHSKVKDDGHDSTSEGQATPAKKLKLSRGSGSLPPPLPNYILPSENYGHFPEITVSSSLSNEGVGPSAKPCNLPPALVNTHSNSSSSSSHVTSPATTPPKAAATISALPYPDDVHGTSDAANSGAKPSGSRRYRSLPNTTERKVTRKSTVEEKQRVQAERVAKKTAQKAKREAEKLRSTREENEARMTPLEYAAILQEKWKIRVANTPREKLFLTDKIILLIFEEQNKAHKDTRIKLDIIARHGGKVAQKYDSNIVTHIIPASTSITLKKTLRTLGLKSLSEIPTHIKTVKWDWIVSGLSKRTPDSEVMHELFKQRMGFMHPTRSTSGNAVKGKEKEGTKSITTEHSMIEEFSSVYDSPNDEHESGMPTRPLLPQVNPGKSVSNTKDEPEDPLLPFYAKAREEAEAEDSDADYSKPRRDLQPNPKAHKYKGFQCDKKRIPSQDASPNWDIIEKLAELRELHRENGTQDDTWRVISYQKAIGSLKSHTTRIKSREEAMKLAGVSDKTADKIMEIVKTGELRRIGYTRSEDLNAMRIFSGIYGVGSNTARKWYNQGLKTLADVQKAVQDGTHKLSTAQEIGLKFYDDINDRMPRAEAQEIFNKIKPIALGLDPKLSMEIMGSFRRGKETCGDIDILLTRPTDDGSTHAGILPRLCNILHKQGILTEDLATPDEWGAQEASYRGLCRRDATSKRRRIDILCIPYESRGAARIYYTGDDIFNRSIRLKANKMNMSLNQRGLFEGVVRDPQDRRKKLCAGSLLCSHSEKKIFKILGVPWQEPHERVRSG